MIDRGEDTHSEELPHPGESNSQAQIANHTAPVVVKVESQRRNPEAIALTTLSAALRLPFVHAA
ncbi:hypothetical protein CGZ80_23465 [Rhodopirellula sp. MGV]|nr:hypothetical protein CGZ80_23465 [Rhodopirellula sp. MGV]PNY33436.1 hypothetical protein C2E31_28475 [Rhodopirellula baltica]